MLVRVVVVVVTIYFFTLDLILQGLPFRFLVRIQGIEWLLEVVRRLGKATRVFSTHAHFLRVSTRL